MSKIKLESNPSGTGTFTIQSPASSTDRVLTLPDEAGTVLTSGGAIDVDASAPADSVMIDSSGNLKFNSGYGSAATAYGCRAWVNFNGTGTVAIREDGNVSSITDNGTGVYQVNFSTALVDEQYAALASVEGSGAAERVVPYGYSTTSVNLYCTSQTTTQDMSVVTCAIIR